MNPRLVKFMVELQNPEQKEEKVIYFKDNTNFFRNAKLVKITVPIDKE